MAYHNVVIDNSQNENPILVAPTADGYEYVGVPAGAVHTITVNDSFYSTLYIGTILRSSGWGRHIFDYSTDGSTWVTSAKETSFWNSRKLSNSGTIRGTIYVYNGSGTAYNFSDRTGTDFTSYKPENLPNINTSTGDVYFGSYSMGNRDRTIYFRTGSTPNYASNVVALTLVSFEGTVKHTITCTLPEHTTASITFPYQIEDGQSTSFTVSPASGYKITDLSAKVGDVSLGVSQLTTGSWTITTGEVTADEEIVITATVIEDTVTVTVNTDVDSNVTVDGKTTTLTKGKDFTLAFTLPTTEEYDKVSYSVITTPEVSYDTDPVYNDDSEIIGGYYTWSKVQQDFTIDLSVHRTDLSYSVTISNGTTYNDLVLSHTPDSTTSLSGAQTITVTLGSNSTTESYRFSDAPVAEKTSGGLITGALSTNKQTATYSIPEDNTENITITVADDNIETFTPTPTTEDYPYFTYAYLPTAGQIKTIADAQWLSDQGIVDLITYANRYEQLFDTLTSDKTREVYLGNVDVGIKAAYLESRVFTRDLGSIAIEEHFHDADDYVSTTIRLYVPLYGYIDLDPSDCMGHSIGLSYKYEVDSGRALAMVYCDFLTPQTILWQGAVNFAIEEPIGSLGSSDYTSSYWTILTQQLGELKPYVVITRKTPATDILDVRGRRGQKVVKVSDVTGFVKFDTIFLTGLKASLTELNEISSYLKTGVLVN